MNRLGGHEPLQTPSPGAEAPQSLRAATQSPLAGAASVDGDDDGEYGLEATAEAQGWEPIQLAASWKDTTVTTDRNGLRGRTVDAGPGGGEKRHRRVCRLGHADGAGIKPGPPVEPIRPTRIGHSSARSRVSGFPEPRACPAVGLRAAGTLGAY